MYGLLIFCLLIGELTEGLQSTPNILENARNNNTQYDGTPAPQIHSGMLDVSVVNNQEQNQMIAPTVLNGGQALSQCTKIPANIDPEENTEQNLCHMIDWNNNNNIYNSTNNYDNSAGDIFLQSITSATDPPDLVEYSSSGVKNDKPDLTHLTNLIIPTSSPMNGLLYCNEAAQQGVSAGTSGIKPDVQSVVPRSTVSDVLSLEHIIQEEDQQNSIESEALMDKNSLFGLHVYTTLTCSNWDTLKYKGQIQYISKDLSLSA